MLVLGRQHRALAILPFALGVTLFHLSAAAWGPLFLLSSQSGTSGLCLRSPILPQTQARCNFVGRTTRSRTSQRGARNSGASINTAAPTATESRLLASSSPPGEDIPADGEDAPPPFKLDDAALDVFSQPFFKPTDDVKIKKLEGLSVRQAFEMFFTKKYVNGVDGALDAMSDQFGINYASIVAYYAAADLPARKVLAASFLRAKYRCDFKECVIEVGAALDPLRTARSSTSRTIDTAFLDPLRLDEEEPFLTPTTVYVRDCMRSVFGLMMEDVASNKKTGTKATALIGSPGVGKSILIFLAALAQAQDRPVGYYRRTSSESESASLFYMTPEEGKEGSVRVWFTRVVSGKALNKNGGLTVFSSDVEDALTIQQEAYYAYVDGPKATDTLDLLDGKYDYLCTSGGFPSYKSEESGKRRWILDGWTRDEAIDGLVTLGVSAKVAEEVYQLCGGRIREMLKACVDYGEVESELDEIISDVDESVVKLAVFSTDRVGTTVNPGRLRTMFERRPTLPRKKVTWKWRMRACQRVDSPYLMNALMNKLGAAPFFEAYKLGAENDSGSAEGIFFECLFHQRVRAISADLPPIQDVCWSKGKAVQGLKELDRSNLYWKPSTSNFKGADAALVHNETLYVFQFTILAFKASFNGTALKREFVATVRKAVSFERTVVVFVSPVGTNYRIDKHAVSSGTLELEAHAVPKNITYRAEEVDTTSVEAIDESIRRIFSGLDRSEGPTPMSKHSGRRSHK